MNRAQWLKAKQSCVGASEVAAILGVDPRRGALAVYTDKIQGYSQDDNDWLKFGRDIEGAVANMYEAKTGRPVQDLGATKIQYHPDLPILGATLDRITWHEDCATNNPISAVPLQLKHVSRFDTHADEWQADPPLHIQIQVQAEMACYGSNWGSLAGLFPGYQLVWKDLELNQPFIDAALLKVDEFWFHVKRQIPPPLQDTLPGTQSAVKRLYAVESGETVHLTAEESELVRERFELKKDVRIHSKRVDEIDTIIRSKMGEATFGELTDSSRVSLKVTHKKGFTKTYEPMSYRTLRRVKG